MLSFNRGVTEETQDPSFFVDDSLPSPFGSVADTIQDAFQGFPPVHNNIVQDSFPPIRGGAAASCSIHEVVAAHGITFTSPPQQPPQPARCEGTGVIPARSWLSGPYGLSPAAVKTHNPHRAR